MYSHRFTKFWMQLFVLEWAGSNWSSRVQMWSADELKSPQNVFSYTCIAVYFSKETGFTGSLAPCSSGGGAWWDVTSLCGLTSLSAEVFHSDPAGAAWADIIREGAVDTRECVGYWPVMSAELCVFVCGGAGTSILVVVIACLRTSTL